MRPRDPYTGLLITEPHWMLNPPGERMPYPPGRHCHNPACHLELSRYDPGPNCYPCELEARRQRRREEAA